MKKTIFFVLFLLIPSFSWSSWNAYVVSPSVKYRPWDSVPADATINLKVARGQWASFQVGCVSLSEDVTGANVTVTTPTMGGNTLSAPIIYKEETYNVLVKSRDDGVTGEWPDPLIPKVDAYYLEERGSFPFDNGMVGPVYPVFTINVSASSPVTRANGAAVKPFIYGTYSGPPGTNYHIKIIDGGASGDATFKFSTDGGATWSALLPTGSGIALNNDLSATFAPQTYTSNDEWEFFASTFRNQMIWVEAYVPLDASTGTYSSTVTVSATSKSNIVLTVNFTVYNVAIPKTSTIPSFYTGSRDDIAKGHYQGWQNVLYENLYKRYQEAGLKHRLAFQKLPPILVWNGSAITNWATYETWVAPYLNGTWDTGTGDAQLTAISVPHLSGYLFDPILYTSIVREADLTTDEKAYLGVLNDLINADGWMGSYYLVFGEEPSGTGFPTVSQTNAIKNGAISIHTADAGYKTILTKRYVSSWNDGSIDTWAPGIYVFDSYPRSSYDSEVAAGRKIWSYLSCESKGCNITGNSSYNVWPSNMVDATLPNLRGYYWLMWDNDIRGDVYYSITDGYRYYISSWSSPSPYDAWDSMFDFGGDGDGTLFFPGRPDKIGGETDIPIETLRLKAIRMGLEDYEIFKIVSAAGHSAEVTTQIQNAVGNGKYYYVSPQPSGSDMDTARDTILGYMGTSGGALTINSGPALKIGTGAGLTIQ